jgi:hypothetical protein
MFYLIASYSIMSCLNNIMCLKKIKKMKKNDRALLFNISEN